MQNLKVEDNHFPQNQFIRVKENLLDLSVPKVMGIVNLTENSFFSSSRVSNDRQLIQKVLGMINDGVDLIDLGASSSKPGAEAESIENELLKIEGATKIIRKEFPDVIISIDTFRSQVAQCGIDFGADIINDISAGNLDAKMFETVAKNKTPYIMMHMKGEPKNMQSQTDYENIIIELIQYFSKKINELSQLGLHDIIIDPGFGLFSKTLAQNYLLLDSISELKILEKPILAGLSRKSMIYSKLNTTPEEALNGTSILNTKAILNGVSILRVHDVKEAKQIISLLY